MDVFTDIESKINSIFEAIIQSAEIRKIELLKEVNILRNEWTKRREESIHDIQELEDKVSKLNAINVKYEQPSNILQNKVASIHLKMEELNTKIKEPEYQFESSNACQIIQLIETTGNIVTVASKNVDNYYEILGSPYKDPKTASSEIKVTPVSSPKFKSYKYPLSPKIEDPLSYENLTDVCTLATSPTETSPQEQKIVSKPHKIFWQNKAKSLPKLISDSSPFQGRKKPILSFGKRGNKIGQLTQPRGIFFEEKTQHIYVVSRELRKILVFSATGDFVSDFGNSDLEGPSSVAIQFGICFVTDEKLNGVLKYRESDFSLLRTFIFERGIEPGRFKSLKSIAIDSGNVYLVDTGNNQVCVLTINLKIKSILGQGILQQPQDITIRDIIYVLDLDASSCVHMFTKEYEPINSIICTSGLGMESFIPNYFCVTKGGIIILSFLYGNTLKVFSNEGLLVQEIGQKKITKETLTNSQGVCLTADNRVVCAFAEGNTCINIY